jgi:nicotinamidase-related amidase
MEAFLIIDIQNDYFEGGKMALKGAYEAAENARDALQYFRRKAVPVIHIRHIDIHNRLAFFKPNTFGAEIHQSVKPADCEPIFIKHTPNAFFETELLSYLRGSQIHKLTICGMMTHICIDATTRAAKDFEFEVRLLADACTTMDLEFNGKFATADLVHASFVAALAQYYAEPVKTSKLLSEQ